MQERLAVGAGVGILAVPTVQLRQRSPVGPESQIQGMPGCAGHLPRQGLQSFFCGRTLLPEPEDETEDVLGPHEDAPVEAR